MRFHQNFSTTLHLAGQKLLLATVRPHHTKHIDAGLGYMSSESIRNRFMGSKKEFTPEELKYLTELDGINHFALGVMDGEDAPYGIAIARLVRLSAEPEAADVAITIIDEYQRKGLGTILMKLLILGGLERGMKKFYFTCLPQNEGINRLLGKLGKLTDVYSSHDTKTQSLDLIQFSEDKLRAELLPFLPEIGSDQKESRSTPSF